MAYCIPKCCTGCNSDDEFDESNTLNMWRMELVKFSCGEFSFAVAQGNEEMEDHCQVETGMNDAIFVGVYDGHGGDRASTFINDQLFDHVINIAKEIGTINEDILRGAFAATEEGFFKIVERSYASEPMIATIGSCCLVGVIWKGTLYIANVGDSRAVIGSIVTATSQIIAEQLTTDHNASREEIRQELTSSHPQDPNIVLLRNGAWRVKGLIQVSRSIGDVHLKRPGFSVDHPRFRLPEPIREPVLKAEPFVTSRVLQPDDKFLIFASDGFWEHLSNQEAADIVHKNPRNGIARILLKAALKEAARKRNMKYKQLLKLAKGRRDIHDDITVIVVFIDHELIGQKVNVPEMSIKGFTEVVVPSNFRNIQELM